MAMRTLLLAYKGAHSNDLYTASFDGRAWRGNKKIRDPPGGINPKSDRTPGSCQYGDDYYLVYKGASSSQLHMASWNSYWNQWNGDKPLSEFPGHLHAGSSSSPSLVVFNERMYAVYKAAHSQQIQVAWYDGETWEGDVPIDHMPGGIAPRTDNGLQAVVFNGVLFLIYKHVDDLNLRICWFDGSAWSGDIPINSMKGGISPRSTHNPGAAVYSWGLEIVYKGASSDRLHSASFDGDKWSGDTPIENQPGGISPDSNDSPSLVAFDDRLYVAYKGASSNALYTASFQNRRWSGNEKIEDQPGGISPDSNFGPSASYAKGPESLGM